MNVIYLLKSEIVIIEQGEHITLKSDRLHLSLRILGVFDKEILVKERLLKQVGVPSGFDNLFFEKTIHKLIQCEFIEIQCEDLIRIEYMSPELLPKLLKRTPANPGKREFSSNLAMEVMDDKFRITSPHPGLILTIKQNALADILSGTQGLELLGLLEALGLFKHESLAPEILAKAFQFQTTRGLGSIHDPTHQVSFPWKGIPTPFSLELSEFQQVLINRKSSPIQNESTPAWARLNDWMYLIYGARMEEGRIKLNYPSAGGSYSVCLYLSYPEETSDTLYSYDPFQRTFTAIKNIPRVGITDKAVHVYLAGKTDELKMKYKNISFRLLMLDAGVLLQQMSLATSAIRMKGRIVGFVHEEQIKTKFKGAFSENENLLAEYTVFE